MTSAKLLMTKVCLLFLFLSNTAIADSANTFDILTIPNEKEFLLTADIATAGMITINIKNLEGNVLFSKRLKAKDSFEQKYDLNSLEIGSYTLAIEDETKAIMQPFSITATTLEIDATTKATTYKPYLKFHETKKSLAINWMKNDTSDYVMKIQDDNSNTLLEESLKNNRLIHRSYDFSDLPKGTYYITIKDENHTYSKRLEIK